MEGVTNNTLPNSFELKDNSNAKNIWARIILMVQNNLSKKKEQIIGQKNLQQRANLYFFLVTHEEDEKNYFE